MKKVIYSLGLVMILGSVSLVFAKDLKSEERIGNVGAYERVFTISKEDCLKNFQYNGGVKYDTICEVDVLKKSNEEGDADFPDKVIEMELPFKDGIVLIEAWAYPYGYDVRATSYRVEDGKRNYGSPITKEDFADLIEKFLKEKGSEISVKFIKIEK